MSELHKAEGSELMLKVALPELKELLSCQTIFDKILPKVMQGTHFSDQEIWGTQRWKIQVETLNKKLFLPIYVWSALIRNPLRLENTSAVSVQHKTHPLPEPAQVTRGK